MTERQPIIAGNWKMHYTHLEAIQVVQKLSYGLSGDDYESVDVVVCPGFTALRSVQTTLESDRIPIALGAQDCFFEKEGAYTGEVSATMLSKLNVRYVIVGHSERRQFFGDTDEVVNKKLHAVVAGAMKPILCVGESLEQRDAGETESWITSQVKAGLHGLSAQAVAGLVIAYEPIWAIGTGRTANPADAAVTIGVIRQCVRDLFGAEIGDALRIQYGGSVKAGNIAEFMAEPEIDGALVGGASLDPEEFARIIRYGSSAER